MLAWRAVGAKGISSFKRGSEKFRNYKGLCRHVPYDITKTNRYLGGEYKIQQPGLHALLKKHFLLLLLNRY